MHLHKILMWLPWYRSTYGQKLVARVLQQAYKRRMLAQFRATKHLTPA